MPSTSARPAPGKTNALLYWPLKLFNRKDIALVLIDPHGDAAFKNLLLKIERLRKASS